MLSYVDEGHLEYRFRCSLTQLPSPIDTRPGVLPRMLVAFPGRFFGNSGAVLSFPDSPFLSVAFPIPESLIAPL